MCYFSIYGHSVADVAGTSGEQGRRNKPIRRSDWRADHHPPLKKTHQQAEKVVSYVYETVDAQLLSFADRKYDANSAAGSPLLRAQDDHNVSYFETDYPAMVQLLHAAGAAHGQVFYDLGCGSGKALLSAALSGIRFVKCVGVEVLPSLASAAVQAVGVLSVNHSSNSGADLFRTPRAPTPTQSAVPKGQDQRYHLMQLPSSSLV
jgi:SAM-dependent methyltransferase